MLIASFNEPSLIYEPNRVEHPMCPTQWGRLLVLALKNLPLTNTLAYLFLRSVDKKEALFKSRNLIGVYTMAIIALS